MYRSLRTPTARYTSEKKSLYNLPPTVGLTATARVFCPDGIANISSLANVSKTRSVKFDSSNGNQFEVTKNDGKKRIFKQSEHGLYYYDMCANQKNKE